MNVNQTMIFAVVRAAVIAFGAGMVKEGQMTQQDADSFAGAVMVVAGVVWSLIEKHLNRKPQ